MLIYQFAHVFIRSLTWIVFFFKTRSTRAELLLQLAQSLLPHLGWGELSQILLAAAVPPDDLVALSPEVAQGILGEEAPVYRITGTGNLPADIQRTTSELQEAAARLRTKPAASQAENGFWRPPPVDQKWSKEAS